MDGPHDSRVVDDPVIDALVASATEDDPLNRRQLLGSGLCERNSGGSREDHVDRRIGFNTNDPVEGLAPGIRLHDHAGATAARGVIDSTMTIVGPVAQVMGVDLDQTIVDSLS